MIAPLKESTLAPREAAQWAGARRAVAALLLRNTMSETSSAPTVSRRTAWLFVAWAVAIAAIYLTRDAWWFAPGP